MKIIKSALSILLICAMLLMCFSCAGDGGKDKVTGNDGVTTPSADTTKPLIEYEEDNLPDTLNFGGEKVAILSNGSGNCASDVTVEELSSDVVNDSIYNRELFVEDRLGVEIENYKSTTTGQDIQKQLNSGEDEYQIFVEQTYDFSSLAFDGVLLDLNTVDYLEFDKPWWSSLFVEEATLGDSLYIATGPITLSLLRNLMVVYYNKTIAEDYSQSNANLAELADLYSVVEDGNWTLDKLHTLSSSVYNDRNGSTSRDGEDLYGLGFHIYSFDAIWSSFDLNILSRSDDWFEIDINTEKLYNVLEKTTDLIHNSDGAYVYDDFNLHSTASMFASGQFLFALDYLRISEGGGLRNMADDYGILPFPKFDDKQSDYYSYCYDDYLSYAIPYTNGSPEIAGAVMEAMASYSYRHTYPAYLDAALKGQYMNDPQSRRMVDIVVNNFKLDTAWVYIFSLGAGYPAEFRQEIITNDRTFASEHATASRTLARSLIAFKMAYESHLDD